FRPRGFARPVTADHGNALAMPYLKRQVLERPELAARRLRLAPTAHQAVPQPTEAVGQNVAQSRVPRHAGVAELVFLPQMFNADDDVRHAGQRCRGGLTNLERVRDGCRAVAAPAARAARRALPGRPPRRVACWP